MLVLGIGQSNYILQLYGTIKTKLPEYSFTISGLRPLFDGHIDDKAKEVFSEIINLNNIKWSFWDKLFAFLFILTKKCVYKEFIITFLEKGISRGIARSLKDVIVKENIIPFLVANQINKTNTAVLHFHFIAPEYVYIIKFLSNRFKIISTFWGSDLMRTNGFRSYYYQTLALNKSNIISCTTYDMANIILSKYGRELEPKIRYAKFIHDPKVYELIDYYRENCQWQAAFKEKFEINPNNKIIIIGHNATPANNHIPILESFKVLNDCEQAEITCVIPLTYGSGNKEHVDLLKRISTDFKMQFVFLESYMSWEELAQLKLVADIMIHMPKSDGLSAALTEFFFTGGLVVTGSWLPYNTFCQAGLFYYHYPDFGGLKKFLSLELKGYKKQKLSNNVKIIREIFDLENISGSWVSIFKELL